MTLLSPGWLLLLVPLLVAAVRWRAASRPGRWLRTFTYLLAVLAMARAALLVPGRGGTVVVVADRSASLPADAAAREAEVVSGLRAAMRGDDRLGVVAFATGAAVEQPAGRAPFGGFTANLPPGASELAAGLERAAASLPAEGSSRLLVLSDGRWTGADPADVAARLALRGVAVDYRLLERSTAGDFAVARLDAPAEVSPGETFLVTAWLWAPRPATVDVALQREAPGSAEPVTLVAGRQALATGLNRVVFRDRAAGPELRAYRIALHPPADDREPGNDVARFLVQVKGRRPVLVVRTRAGDAGLPDLLRRGGLAVETASPARLQSGVEGLAGVGAVVLEDLPASALGSGGLTALVHWVSDGGGGLLVTGGRGAFGSGGYFGSELEPVLPVSMELRREHRKLRLAMLLTLDRSGSMAVPIGGGRTKMDLADLAAATVVDLLSPIDDVGVHAVDSMVHRVVPLGPLRDADDVRQRILRIDSAGGGIFVGEALEAAAADLLGSAAGTRHVILFADAADAEEPGNYRELLARMTKAGITVSVVGLGTEKDSDAGLLREIAQLGGGQVYFTDDPKLLPRIFAQDTVTVARSAFVEEATPLRTTPGLRLLTGLELGDPPPAGGYNLTYLRPGATLGMVTTDSYRAPVVASWQAGLGRVAAVTAQLDGPWTGALARWPRLGELVTSLARWTAGEEGALPAGAAITQELVAGGVAVTLHLDPARARDPFAGPPRLLVLRGRPGATPERVEAPLAWQGPDALAATVPLGDDEVALVNLDAPGFARHPLAPVRLPVPAELVPAPPGSGRRELERLARMTGGRERLDAAGVWEAFPRRGRPVELAPWLLLLAVVTVLLEVADRRLGSRWWAGVGRRADATERRRARASERPLAAGDIVVAPARDGKRELAAAPAVAPDEEPPAPPEGSVDVVAAMPGGEPPAEMPGPGATVLDALAEARRRARERLGR